MVPALRVARFLLVVQSLMDQLDRRAAVDSFQIHGHRRCARRQLGIALPAPGVDDALSWLDFREGTHRRVARRDSPAVVPADAKVHPRRDNLPAAEPLRFGDEGERCIRVNRNEDSLVE